MPSRFGENSYSINVINNIKLILLDILDLYFYRPDKTSRYRNRVFFAIYSICQDVFTFFTQMPRFSCILLVLPLSRLAKLAQLCNAFLK